MANELYHTLEIAPEAAPEEIRRAYFRLVRRFPPEKEPEKFKGIREAYETLSDPKARRNYDALQEHGDVISDLFAEAEALMGEEKWEEAIRPLKRILVLWSGADAALNSLGLCHLHLEQYDEAHRIYEALTTRCPDVPVYWLNQGHGFLEQAEAMEDDDYRLPGVLIAARGAFSRAMEMESYNAQPYILMARSYVAERNFAEAEAWLERAVGADGKMDFNDFEALVFLCIVQLYAGQLHRIHQTASRISTLMVDDEDARQYAAGRFASLAQQLVDKHAFEEALTFLEASARFAPDDEDIQGFRKAVLHAVNVRDEYERLKNDYSVCDPLRKLCAFFSADYCGELEVKEDEEKGKLFDSIMQEFGKVSPFNIVTSVQRLRAAYRAIYELNTEAFDGVEETARKMKGGDVENVTPASSPGCSVLAAALAVVVVLCILFFRSALRL